MWLIDVSPFILKVESDPGGSKQCGVVPRRPVWRGNPGGQKEAWGGRPAGRPLRVRLCGARRGAARGRQVRGVPPGLLFFEAPPPSPGRAGTPYHKPPTPPGRKEACCHRGVLQAEQLFHFWVARGDRCPIPSLPSARKGLLAGEVVSVQPHLLEQETIVHGIKKKISICWRSNTGFQSPPWNLRTSHPHASPTPFFPTPVSGTVFGKAG